MALMKAVQLISHGKPGKFRVGEVKEPKLADTEALVRVRACGLNHLDLWMEEGDLPIPLELPRIPGSEIAGEIAALGSQAHGWSVGDRVAVQSNLFCGSCEYCVAGDESLCLQGQLLGVQRDGGFAELAAVPAQCLVRLPDTVSYETSAALTLAGSTAMHMLTNRTKVQAGQWVLVMAGASGVGVAAIQIAEKLGAHVIATGSTPAKRALAMELGAMHTVDSTQASWPVEVRKITEKRGVDLVIEHVGGEVFEKVFHCLARGGTVVTCGATAGREVRLNLWPFFVKQHRLIGSYGRTREDLRLTLEWAAEGKLKAVIDQTVSLENAPESFARLRKRDALGKLVIAPSKSNAKGI